MRLRIVAAAGVALLAACADGTPDVLAPLPNETGTLTDAQVDPALQRVLVANGVTGRINDRLTQ